MQTTRIVIRYLEVFCNMIPMHILEITPKTTVIPPNIDVSLEL